jgi:aminoglycoside phosphotransferase (APT) family kinase protein
LLSGVFEGRLPTMTVPNLTVDTIVPYLIEKNLVSAAAIVEGDFAAIDAGRRNQSLKIVVRRGPSYLIKQPGEGERSTDATLRCEAWFYNRCRFEPYAAALQSVLPALCGWDEDRRLLVLELIDGCPLWAHYAATPAPEFPSDAAAPLGEALGTVHRVFRQWLDGPEVPARDLHCAAPWIVHAHRPTPETFSRMSPANLQLLRWLQKDGALTAGLDGLRTEWRAETLIHNDIKGDNILVTKRADEGVRVRIVDWELIQIGDPAWDVGNLFRDFLDYWLLSVPLSGDLKPEEMLERAQLPLTKLHPAARAFWHAYRASAELDTDAGAFLTRALRFAAARMAQGACELSFGMHEPSNLGVAMLQLAANILDDPRDASLHLFGIPIPWNRPGHAIDS